jgi:hypothetical protein
LAGGYWLFLGCPEHGLCLAPGRGPARCRSTAVHKRPRIREPARSNPAADGPALDMARTRSHEGRVCRRKWASCLLLLPCHPLHLWSLRVGGRWTVSQAWAEIAHAGCSARTGPEKGDLQATMA